MTVSRKVEREMLRNEYLERIDTFFAETFDEEVLRVKSNEIAIPVVGCEGNEDFKEKELKAKEKEEKKKKKIAKDEEIRKKKKEIAEKNAEQAFFFQANIRSRGPGGRTSTR